MQPHGHNRGIMGVSTWFTPLSVSLSPEGANCWSQGCERPASAEYLQTNTAHSTQRRHTHTHTHKHMHTDTKRWSLSRSDRFHSATLYLHCGMSGAIMAFDTSHRMTTVSSNFGRWLTTMGLSVPQSLCYSSAWSLRQSSVTEVPIELEQSLTKEPLTWCFQPSCQDHIVPHSGQCAVKVNWHHMQPCSERLLQLDFVAQLMICKHSFHEIFPFLWATVSDSGLVS